MINRGKEEITVQGSSWKKVKRESEKLIESGNMAFLTWFLKTGVHNILKLCSLK